MLNKFTFRQKRFWVIVLAFGLSSSLAMAGERFLIEGIFDMEEYKTDTDSRFLSRNDGDISTLLRLQLWSAYQISSGFQIYALGEIEVEDSSGEFESEMEIEQFALRYSVNPSANYFFEAGKLLTPVGAFSGRRLSTINPLIGQPDTYESSYPWGIQMTGSSTWFDYRVALVDLPAINERYLPGDPGSEFRPALGVGVTPFTGLRFGASYTQGPYLHQDLDDFLPPSAGWKDFDQRLLGFDVQFSRGYLELNGELMFSEYEVPTYSEIFDGTVYYLELKYTWSPRFYTALRIEHNKYPFFRHRGGLSWLARTSILDDIEVGLGYRFSPNTQLKLAYRRELREGERPDGYSLSLQLSHFFDLRSLFLQKQ